MSENWHEHFHEGLSRIADEKFGEAVVQLSQALVEAPDDYVAQCYATRGYAYLCDGQFERALDDCNLAIEHDPTDGEAYAWRGSAQAGLRKWRAAMDDYVDAIRLAPDKQHEYGEVLLEHVKQAIGEYSRVIRGGAATVDVFRNRGVAYAIREEYEKAAGDFSQAIDMEPTDGDCYIRRAECFLALKIYPNAVNDCTRATRCGINDAHVYFVRAGRCGSLANMTKRWPT